MQLDLLILDDGPEVEAATVEAHIERPDHDVVEGVDAGDIGRALVGCRHQDPATVGAGPHEVVERADGRRTPCADHEPVAGGEAGAGDVTYECVSALARSRFRLLDATVQMAAAKATDTMARAECTALNPVDRVSSPRMLRMRVTQMKRSTRPPSAG